MSQVDRVSQEETLSAGSSFGPNPATPTRELERTAENVLAKLEHMTSDRDKLEVQALFKIVAQDHDQGRALKLRLWRLWGQGEIEAGNILASCEYDPETFEVSKNKIFLAYEALDSHRINGHSYAAKVHAVDPTALKPETQSPTLKSNPPLQPRVKMFQDLVGNLAPGHAILIRIRLQNSKQIIEPEQVVVVRSLSTPVSTGFGPFPEEGSCWGLVGKVTSEGLVEISAEYKVLKSRPTSTKNNWRAQFEKTPNDRKLFSLIDIEHNS